MKRVAFYVDGYNLYHAIAEVARTQNKNYLKWIDLRKLFLNFIHKDECLADIFFFTAEPKHTRRDVQERYGKLMIAYQRFLKIKVQYGKFKAKDEKCHTCESHWTRHEEKETDVNLAVGLVQGAYEKTYDLSYLVTQDSDLAPAAKLAEKVYPGHLRLLTPPGKNPSQELARILKRRVAQIKEVHLEHSLMPKSFCDEEGKIIVERPSKYDPPFAIMAFNRNPKTQNRNYENPPRY